jgi:hypothetical protein
VPALTFPPGQAMGTLELPGSGATPVLASGVVTVPDGVEIALDVTVIESVRRTDAQRRGVHITLTIKAGKSVVSFR